VENFSSKIFHAISMEDFHRIPWIINLNFYYVGSPKFYFKKSLFTSQWHSYSNRPDIYTVYTQYKIPHSEIDDIRASAMHISTFTGYEQRVQWLGCRARKAAWSWWEDALHGILLWSQSPLTCRHHRQAPEVKSAVTCYGTTVRHYSAEVATGYQDDALIHLVAVAYTAA